VQLFWLLLHILFWKGPVDQSKVFIVVATYSGKYQFQKLRNYNGGHLGIIEQKAVVHLFWKGVPLNFDNTIYQLGIYMDYSAALVPWNKY